MIEVEGLCKYYGGRRAIENVSFSINKGEIIGLLGLNGAGKSTVLKIQGCFLMPSGGRAKVAGFSVEDSPDEIRRQIGYLPDTPPLYNEMTVWDYLTYVGRIKDVPEESLHRKVDRSIQKTNLGRVVDFRLGELSHGFRQRVSIAQALVHEPPVLILDEPINGLDPVQIVEMRDLILSLRGDHTVILSSHILSEITRTCDRILIIDQGRLVAEGNEDDLETRLVKGMRLVVEVEREGPELQSALKAVNGVTKVERARAGGSNRYNVDCETDLRSAVAQAVVKSGCGLIGLGREEAGLEGLFMKLVKGSARDMR